MPSYLDQLLQSAKTLPGNLFGSGADMANLALGLAAGKGVEGIVKNPIGGSKHLNSLVGLKTESGGLVQDSADAVLGLLSPAGAAKGIVLGGMIVPARLADVANAVGKMKLFEAMERSTTKSAKEIYDITGVFRGTLDSSKGLKAIIDDSSSKMIEGGSFAKRGNLYGLEAGVEVKLGEILDHPKLLDALRADSELGDLADIPVRRGNGVSNASYYPSANNGKGLIEISDRASLTDIRGSLLHEIQHAVQYRTGMTNGANLSYGVEYPGRVQKAAKNAREAWQLASEDVAKLMPVDPKWLKSPENKKLTQLTHDRDAIVAIEEKMYSHYLRTQGEVDARTTQRMALDNREIKAYNPDIPGGPEGYTRADMVIDKELPTKQKYDMEPSIKKLIDAYQIAP